MPETLSNFHTLNSAILLCWHINLLKYTKAYQFNRSFFSYLIYFILMEKKKSFIFTFNQYDWTNTFSFVLFLLFILILSFLDLFFFSIIIYTVNSNSNHLKFISCLFKYFKREKTCKIKLLKASLLIIEFYHLKNIKSCLTLLKNYLYDY